jgi:hypothetical protein
MIEPGRTYGSTQVAGLVFGRSVEWFYANRARLHAREGFPRPVSRYGWPRWSGQDLLTWMNRPKHGGGGGPKVVDFSEVLRERARTIGRRA